MWTPGATSTASACVLYEMLVGQPPFDGPNAMAILARHSMEAVPSLQVVRQSIPDEVEDAVMQALEKTPADRFQTMVQFAEVLEGAEAETALQRTAARRAATVRRASGASAARRRTSGGIPTKKGSLPARVIAFGRAQGARFWVPAAALFLLAGGLSAWRIWLKPGAASGTTAGFSPNHIAVMYLENRGGQDSLGYLADGLTESLIRELSQVPTLQVISRNGVSPYRKANVAPDSVARALKVGTLVTGDVTQSGDRLRVGISLVNAGTGAEIGSKILERPRQEIFALQDDLAKEVAVFLRQRLGQEVELRKSRQRTNNPAAWELLQKAEQEIKGVDPLVTAGDVPAATRQFLRADSLLAKAETADPKWVTPVTQRGWLTYRQARLSGSFDKTYYGDRITKGLGHVDQALKLQPGDPDALELRGTLQYLRWLLNLAPDPAEAERLMVDAEKDLRASVAANPEQASAWNTLSHLLINKLETAEAKLAALRAYDADPYLTSANLTSGGSSRPRSISRMGWRRIIGAVRADGVSPPTHASRNARSGSLPLRVKSPTSTRHGACSRITSVSAHPISVITDDCEDRCWSLWPWQGRGWRTARGRSRRVHGPMRRSIPPGSW